MNIIEPHLAKATLTGPEKKTLAEVIDRCAEIEGLRARYARSWHDTKNVLAGELSENPTPAAAEAFADHLLREPQWSAIQTGLADALKPQMKAAIDRLQPAALRLLDQLAEAVRADHKQHVETVKGSPLAETADLPAAQRAVDAQLAYLAELARSVREDGAALHVLQNELAIV